MKTGLIIFLGYFLLVPLTLGPARAYSGPRETTPLMMLSVSGQTAPTLTAAERSAILSPSDSLNVQQARLDYLLDIRRRYWAYSRNELGGFVDMLLRNEPQWDRQANDAILKDIHERLQRRDVEVWNKQKPWDGQIYPMEGQYSEVYYRYGSRLSAAVKIAIEDAWQQALFTDLEAHQRGTKYFQSGSFYWSTLREDVGSNWGLVGIQAAVLGGQIAHRQAFVNAGREALKEWFKHASAGMASTEDNPMDGHWQAYSATLVPVAEWAHDPQTRRLARLLLERLWLEKLLYFHVSTLREIGASGRTVSVGRGEPIVDTNDSLLLATQLNRPIPYPKPPAPADTASRNPGIIQNEPYLVSHWRIPEYLQDIAFQKTLPQVLKSSITQEIGPGPQSIPSHSTAIYPDLRRNRLQSNDFYTYLTQSFSLGSMSRNFWDIGMPLLAFWKAHDLIPNAVGDHHAIYFRFQQNDRKPFGQVVEFLRGQKVVPPPISSWSEFGRHAVMQDHGRAILIYRPRLDYLLSYGLVPGVPATVSLDGDLAVTSLQALACFYREDLSPRGFFIGAEPVKSFPATVRQGQWVFVDDGETWIALRPLESTDLGGARPPQLVTGDRHVFLQVDNLYSAQPIHPDFGGLMRARNGFLLAVGDQTDYASFAAFREQIIASKITESFENAVQRVEWSAGGKTLRLGWDVFEEHYLERSVDGTSQDDPWPGFSSPEYKQAQGEAQLGEVKVTTGSTMPVWLLADRSAQTFVVYQPTPDSLAPLNLTTPLGRVAAADFPFGKIVFRALTNSSGIHWLRLDIDADYPVKPLVDVTVETASGTPLTATINGEPAFVSQSNEKGRWHVSATAAQ